MGRNRTIARKSPKKLAIRSASKHTNKLAPLSRVLLSEDMQPGSSNTLNIQTDHSYATQDRNLSETPRFEFLKNKSSGELTVAHLNVEKLGVLKRRELEKMLKSLDIDLLSIVEHHIPMDETEKVTQTVKNCHSLLIPGYGTLSKHRSSWMLHGTTRKILMWNRETPLFYRRTSQRFLMRDVGLS